MQPALLKRTDDVRVAMDKKHINLISFFDFSKTVEAAAILKISVDLILKCLHSNRLCRMLPKDIEQYWTEMVFHLPPLH